MPLTIFREIILKQIVTESSIETARGQILAQLEDLNREQEAFKAHKDKTLTEITLKGAEAQQLTLAREKFDVQITQFNLQRDELRRNMMTLGELKVGEERVVGSVEGPCEVKVGDRLDQATQAEIILKDGVIVEIRP
ncbi:MAG: YlqD family protein [Gracilibacteraceae bacterium]|nr:YlqD family protein [Gracilibacteraceae bacterium]